MRQNPIKPLMKTANRRLQMRESSAPTLSPLKCELVEANDRRTSLQIINYHYRGACFKTTPGHLDALESSVQLQFSIGKKVLKEKITFRIVWETIEENGLFGVEFTQASSKVLEREYRFESHRINKPIVTAKDPLDPNRVIYFQVKNLSKSGLLLSTSLTNKHLFPGMELDNVDLNIPGLGETKINLYIENCRSSKDSMVVDYGASVKNPSNQYMNLTSEYVSNLAQTDSINERVETLNQSQYLSKKLSKHLTIRVIGEEKAYQDVLKLRHLGYQNTGKVSKDSTPADMGEGLKNEGFVLGAYLGGQLVASCEFRISRLHHLKIADKFDFSLFQEIDKQNCSEINKLVVHPSAKGSDVVLGIFQKIHTIAIMNGIPDGVILSEPKLVKLYERLGFKTLNWFCPHPKNPDITLQLMLIKGKTYADSTGMNPYAWSVAFELSHRFFHQIGVQSKVNFNWKQKLSKRFTALYLNQYKNRRRTDHPPKNNEERTTNRDIIHPKWTRQHMNASVFLPYLLVSDEMIGKNKTLEILHKYGFEKNYFKKQSNWISIDFFDAFLTEFSAFGDTYQLNREAGYRATSKEILGANYFIMKHFFSPQVAFKAFEKYMPKFNKTRTYKVLDSSVSHCRIRITNNEKDLLPKTHSARENWIALLDAYVLVLTGRPAKIEVINSSFDGDPFCEYLVRWRPPVLKSRSLLVFAALAVATACQFFLLPNLGINPTLTTTFLTLSILAIIATFWGWRSSNNKYNDILESMQEMEHDADTKYRELQNSKQILEKSYQESRLIESINRQIQITEDLSEILNIALENICTRFGFERAFIMILDDDKKVLRTASVYGAKKTVADLWKFNVDVSQKRSNPMLLSSVFHTGQSVVIDNVDDHLFHLNEQSQTLIKSLNVTSFSMVPIPSQRTNWGVLVADKHQSDSPISRRDLTSLKRISQSIGLALDKKSKLDSEITTRKIFQRYVPSYIVDEALKQTEPKLGGTSKEAICLFMDIRNFTSMASMLPPEVLVEILNDVFLALQKSVSAYGGVIDKFLGDGALVTWGVYPGSKLDAMECLNSTHLFLEELEPINERLKPKGLPHIEVGIGIHKGPVIAGNIGSDDRMEYTVIGSTVNLASRLEQLTKKFKSPIVISNTVIEFTELGENWTIEKNVQIRGIHSLQNVACYKQKR